MTIAPGWALAQHAAALLAVDPAGLGGVLLRGLSPDLRERWEALLRGLLPSGTPWRTLPPHIGDERLLGGLDLGATLRLARPVAQRGLLAECDGGLLRVPQAQQLGAALAARLAAVLDDGEVRLAREGFARRDPARLALLAYDDGVEGDDPPPAALADRLALRLDLSGLSWRDTGPSAPWTAEAVAAARERLPQLPTDEAALEALCAAAEALGIASSRAPWFALRVARAAAALAGRSSVEQGDAELAARLVLAPRAMRLPPAPPPDEAPPPEQAEAPERENAGDETAEAGTLEDRLIEAARSSIDPRLLAQLQIARLAGAPRGGAGKRGALQRSLLRGRPIGTLAGEPRRGARLNLIDTLRAAAPWQPLRRREARSAAAVQVRREDFRVTRHQMHRRTTAVFAVDASGSAALHRLAEAKGAVELLLADCYVRRDQVAVLGFRAAGAELLLPPTRSLPRAKRALAGLPGGGGTPLAAGLDAAWVVADAARRRGDTPLVVLLTDGRANIARDGTPDRARAEQDALASAARWRGAGIAALLVDTSPRPDPRARALAERMQARYLPLPMAEAATLSAAVRQAAAALPRA
ncbi:MAG: magnesium chelatase subunit D [Piscinibacter sp.]|uniref:magnesium chelatase subunit D n=1 Tax=Piscinibacter sp. TaxID=1903157 RepID=UPI00258D31CD|nr:magnesium chelatase subunit D [Piscinibacter sp.]MCW5662519.1 magnesium chelatase subunit D [Piscinibacter sp.]